MVVGQNVAFAADDHPCSDSLHLLLITAGSLRPSKEISEKGVIFERENRRGNVHPLSNLDMHDGGHGLLGHIGDGGCQVDRPWSLPPGPFSIWPEDS